MRSNELSKQILYVVSLARAEASSNDFTATLDEEMSKIGYVWVGRDDAYISREKMRFKNKNLDFHFRA